MKNEWQSSYTQKTTATTEAIWLRWTNVEDWPAEDSNLEWSRLEGEFIVGGKIVMKPKGSPKSTVIITEATPDASFETEGKIPFGKLIVSHKVEPHADGTTSFTHAITLTGPFKKLFVKLFAQKLANNLPQKMQNIARLAESI